MTKHLPQQQVIGANSTPDDRTRPTSAPLPAAEIESLLRMAQQTAGQSKSGPQDEEIGPGDVQYLRGNSFADAKPSPSVSMASDWPDISRDPDSTVTQAEQLLADVILDRKAATPVEKATVSGLDANPIGGTRDRAAAPGLTLDDLGELDLDISIELGRTEILIEDILKLREGSVVSLDKLAGDPVDIIANGRLVARGELLVIDGKFGVRLSEVL